jgi:hypothetical protein
MAEIQHVLFRATFQGKLYLAPLENPQNVLDIATGKLTLSNYFRTPLIIVIRYWQLGD